MKQIIVTLLVDGVIHQVEFPNAELINYRVLEPEVTP